MPDNQVGREARTLQRKARPRDGLTSPNAHLASTKILMGLPPGRRWSRVALPSHTINHPALALTEEHDSIPVISSQMGR